MWCFPSGYRPDFGELPLISANACLPKARLNAPVLAGGNIFAALMTAVHDLSLGQVTRALYEVGGQYRRNM
jgi:hypothetical protein